MKKSVIALAIAGTFAVAGAAQAQTTVTPYLTLDASVGSAGSDAGPSFDYFDGAVATSVFGLRASRDLGNGLTAHAHGEGDINTATGNTHGAGTWRRAANVGLSGDFGRIDVGTRINPFIALHGGTYAMGGNTVSSNVAIAMGFADFFPTQSITYTSPSLGGVVVQAQYGILNQAGAAAIGFEGIEDESRVALTAVYADGPLRVGAGINVVSADHSPIAAGPSPGEFWEWNSERTTIMVGGTYTMGDLVLSANFIQNDLDYLDDLDIDTPWFGSVGAAFKLQPQITIGGTVGMDNEGSMLINAQARYHLHPAAHVYAQVTHVDVDDEGRSFSTVGAAIPGVTGYGPAQGESDTGFNVGLLMSF